MYLEFFSPAKRVFENNTKITLDAPKIIALAAISSATTPLLFKNSVQCQGNN
jgi:hypothetical protein